MLIKGIDTLPRKWKKGERFVVLLQVRTGYAASRVPAVITGSHCSSFTETYFVDVMMGGEEMAISAPQLEAAIGWMSEDPVAEKKRLRAFVRAT